ncbi:MAG TPA: GntR family transcriptional regulator [Candidatus Enterocloster faecavium]|uniref:GntR family transcriptional regulator n=1 Tax=Candidatus Enterocloster faecavium TaxID=2838560 RepID=A0A9D2RJN9_9FIRM|nr:GntR family transcriptional regulator [Candidatus Enterocloster faecavium]
MERNLNETTYQLLKQDIMSFALAPGEAISAAKVASRYGVSRTPAREAIVKLEKEGLVDIYPQSKTLVSRINLSRTRQEWYVRYTLEIGMAERFIRKVTQDTIQAMERNLRQMELARDEAGRSLYLTLDHGFHDIIYDTAGEFLAKEIIHTQITHYNRIRYLTDLTPPVREKTILEHRQLISAARKKDEGLFEECLKAHIGRLEQDQQMIQDQYPDYFEAEK